MEIVERILCATNWYPELKLVRENFPSSHLRPKNIDKGIVFCGYAHLQCLYQMIAMTGKRQCEVKEITGFLTNFNRFVEREEGAKIALNCGQIDKLHFSNKDLYSEDLWYNIIKKQK